MVEIRRGLTPETVVITAGQIKIGPGAPVQSISAPATAQKPQAAPAKAAGSGP